jgi:citrate lyase subunit beta/citryl-CoA lyase
MRDCRTLLYVPGDRPEMFPKAARSGADAVVIDLEDAVAAARKAEARQNIASWLAAAPPVCDVHVRVNSPSGAPAELYADVELAAQLGLSGIFVPKVERAEEVLRLDHLLSYLEHRAGLPDRHVELGVIIETAKAARACAEIAACCPRVAAVVAGGGRDGDTARSLGYRWTPEGEETMHFRSAILLDARAAGVRYPLYSGWMEVRDLPGLERDARRTRNLGYAGQLVIHPSHVPVCNAVYGPDPAELAYYRRVVEGFRAAEAEGRAAIQIEGRLVDRAMAMTAAEMLRRGEGGGHG